jgi:hypothetical protein
MSALRKPGKVRALPEEMIADNAVFVNFSINDGITSNAFRHFSDASSKWRDYGPDSLLTPDTGGESQTAADESFFSCGRAILRISFSFLEGFLTLLC